MKIVGLLMTLTLLFIGTPSGADDQNWGPIKADSARLILDRVSYDFCSKDSSGQDIVHGGVLYSEKPVVRGTLVFYNENFEAIARIPVKMTSWAVGIIGYGTLCERNVKVTLSGLNGRKVKDILGNYYGVRIGASILAGAEYTAALNKKGVMLNDMSSYLISGGANAGVSVVTIYRDGSGRFDDEQFNRVIEMQ